jgi:DNA-binding Lrp family transcriptional regulator
MGLTVYKGMEELMKAFVMIHIRAGEIPEVVRMMRRLNGVNEAYMTFGPYDVIGSIEAPDVNALGKLIATGIQPIPGVIDTVTCLVVET